MPNVFWEGEKETVPRIVMSKTPWERCPYPVLKAALEKTDYNQTTLAEATGISATNVSRYVKGDVDVTVRAFLALEDLTGMTFRELFGECEGRRGGV